MNFLDFIPVSIFETVGVFAGLTACFTIAIQIRKEYLLKIPSSLSWTFLIGWIFIYGFWCLYGIRFGAIAMWLTNGIAVIIQIALFFVVFRKRPQVKT
jgi:hypothetical protein